jgi:hypothetical protein
LCTGTFQGTFSNGVQGTLVLDGYSATMYLNGFVFAGPMRCRDFGNQAEIFYSLGHPSFGTTRVQGSITMDYEGRAYLYATQDNGLAFSAVR